jgi:phosphoglycolate phosphatase
LKLIIFDLDGTLIDSHVDLANSTNEMLGVFGAPPRPVEELAGFVGEGAKVLVQRALAAAGLDHADRKRALDLFREIYGRRLLEHTRPYPHIPDVIQRVSRLADLAVLTNKPEAPSRQLLEAFGLSGAFRWVIGGDSDFPRKPDPASTHHLMRSAGAVSETTLFVGDSMIDVETARRAEVRVCVAGYGFGHLRGELRLRDDEPSLPSPTALGEYITSVCGANR